MPLLVSGFETQLGGGEKKNAENLGGSQGKIAVGSKGGEKRKKLLPPGGSTCLAKEKEEEGESRLRQGNGR